MKVLVTGATGFIGSHVADKLLAKVMKFVVWLEKQAIYVG